jgi:hypothetical protein
VKLLIQHGYQKNTRRAANYHLLTIKELICGSKELMRPVKLPHPKELQVSTLSFLKISLVGAVRITQSSRRTVHSQQRLDYLGYRITPGFEGLI